VAAIVPAAVPLNLANLRYSERATRRAPGGRFL